MERLSHFRRFKIVNALIETFGFSPWLATILSIVLMVLAGLAVLWVVLSAPPRTISIISGPPGSSFQRRAEEYQKALAAHGVTLRIIPSTGSLENLQKLQNPANGIDLGFVQGGLIGDKPAPPDLVSLGSVAYQPIFLFYRSERPIDLISELAGKRIGIGVPGSGANTLARALLDLNGIAAAPTKLVEDDSSDGGKSLLEGRLDAIFLMGDSAATATLRALLRDPNVHVYNFVQADAYTRRLPYLNRVVVPRGSIDFGHDLPARDLVLVGPTVEVIAREGLNSAICDLLLGVLRDVHGRATLLSRRNEFPTPLEREFPISSDAARYYKSGKGITYQLIKDNFWLASLINRLLVAIVPFVLVLVPAVRFFPVAYRWSVQLRIYRAYRPLLRLERDAETPLTPPQAEELQRKLDAIERDVEVLKVPASFASQYYDLRNHVVFVRNRIKSAVGAAT